MGKPFNLAETFFGDALRNVPNSDTGPVQITYIDLDHIQPDPRNFYSITGVEDLAASIELVGLQQPILVRPDPEQAGKYFIVSGHRRREAIMHLVGGGHENLRSVPCIVQTEEVSPAMQELRLIHANADTRQLSSGELSLQVDRVRELLYELKEKEHMVFPGRMRDHVAEACKISKSKIARLDAIKAGLEPSIAKAYWFGDGDNLLSEATAYELARLDHDIQRRIIDQVRSADGKIRWITASTVERIREDLATLTDRTCKYDGHCSADGRVQHIIKSRLKSNWSKPDCVTAKCCGTCSELRTCKDACARFADKQKQLKAEHKEQAAQEKAAQEEKERPVIERTKQMWARWDAARIHAGVTEKDVLVASTKYYNSSNIGMAAKIASGEEKVSISTNSPYGWHRPGDFDTLVNTAQFLGVSTDYLLGLCPDFRGTPAEWTKVEDEDSLPKEGEYVFVYCGRGGALIPSVFWRGRFMDDAERSVGNHEISGVLWWMPQPGLPDGAKYNGQEVLESILKGKQKGECS